jgi:hypothetical protein
MRMMKLIGHQMCSSIEGLGRIAPRKGVKFFASIKLAFHVPMAGKKKSIKIIHLTLLSYF